MEIKLVKEERGVDVIVRHKAGIMLSTWYPYFDAWGFGRARYELPGEVLDTMQINPSETLMFRGYYVKYADGCWVNLYDSNGKRIGGVAWDRLLNPWRRLQYGLMRWSAWATTILVLATVLLAGLA